MYNREIYQGKRERARKGAGKYLRLEGRLASPASSRGGEEHVDEGGLDQKNGGGDRSDGLGLPLSTPSLPSSSGGEASSRGAARVGTAQGDWIRGMKLLPIPFPVVPLPPSSLLPMDPPHRAGTREGGTREGGA